MQSVLIAVARAIKTLKTLKINLVARAISEKFVKMTFFSNFLIIPVAMYPLKNR